MDVKLVSAYEKQEEVSALFDEYIRMLLSQGEDVRRCLEAQHYQDETLDLEANYGPPGGRLYLAYLGSAAAGCAALKRTDDCYCEMKRLYVRPGCRGRRIGERLVERIISDAKSVGYRHMRLDTFPFMDRALALYRRHGFYEIGRYNDNPAPSAVFMQLDL